MEEIEGAEETQINRRSTSEPPATRRSPRRELELWTEATGVGQNLNGELTQSRVKIRAINIQFRA